MFNLYFQGIPGTEGPNGPKGNEVSIKISYLNFVNISY